MCHEDDELKNDMILKGWTCCHFLLEAFSIENLKNCESLISKISKGAYTESPSYHKRTPVGAASSREIK
jgi:hypothetical protein